MGTSLRDRVETVVRRGTPVAALPRLVEVRTRSARTDPKQWAEARRQMGFLVGARRPETDLDALSERYLRLMKWRGELRWHPRTVAEQDVEGFEHLASAHAAGNGVILSFIHFGWYDGLFPSLSRLGVPVAAIATRTMFDGTAPLWMRQQQKVAGMGAPTINVETGSRGIVEALKEGRVLGIGSDVASSSTVEFLGRRVRGTTGAARISIEHGVPIVIATSHHQPSRDGQGGRYPKPLIRLHEPLDPASFSDPDTMLGAILAPHEAAVLAWPEAYDQPLKRWGWDDEPGA